MDQGMKKTYAVVIPSRLQSSRLTEKALRPISGIPLIKRVVQGVRKSKLIKEILVATDDARIAHLAEQAGAIPIMTAPDLPSGTDRVLAALKSYKEKPDFIFNVQGDEPLFDGSLLDELIEVIEAEPETQMITCAQTLKGEDVANKNVVKLVLNQNFEAIYFSRFAIPFSRNEFEATKNYERIFKHIGLYGYSSEFLQKFCAMAPSELEGLEGLEQLRALDLGVKIKVHITSQKLHGVDTTQDIEIVERLLHEKNI